MKRIIPVKHVIIYKDTNYNSFPSVVKRQDGSLILAFRHAPDRQRYYGRSHIDPSSKGVTLTSVDGEIWGQNPDVLYDDYFYGVQDPCLNQLRDGTLFATFFMWKVFEQHDVLEPHYRDKLVYGKYVGRPLRTHTIRSTDGGRTWDTPLPVSIEASIRGNCVELNDEAILAPLYVAKEGGATNIFIVRTEDRGKTWTTESVIPSCDGHRFYEPNLYQTPSGKLILFIRTIKTNIQPGMENEKSPLYTCESHDNGQSWSQPTARPINASNPFHALRLDSGHVMLSYGCRIKPYGIRAIILDAECERWDETEEFVLRDDGAGSDIGYPSAVQLNDGSVLVTYYYFDEDDGLRYIAGTICRLS